ncbi:hypothetical protein [Candidatus Laterigemmans baculatus]|nr:hypothetical protein [Candidatus Laterigemmans baculatus]
MNNIPPLPPDSLWPFILNVGAVAQLFAVVILTWAYAWMSGEIPDADAIARFERTGNDPWEHTAMTRFVGFIFFSAAVTACSGIVAFVTTRNTRHRALAALSLLASVIAFGYHFWLID